MPVSSEALLALALIAVYLFDSAHFLCIGEAVITTRGESLRRLSFGSAFELGGRRPLLPNPLTPFWPEFRVAWDVSGGVVASTAQAAAQMRQQLRALRPISWLAGVCAGLILIAAPLALVVGRPRVFVAVVLLCLAIAVVASALVFARRRELGLRSWPAVGLILVALVCLPCAANLARAVAREHRPTVAASELPGLGFDPAQVELIRRQLLEVLSRARQLLPEEGREHRTVSAQLQRLQSRADEFH